MLEYLVILVSFVTCQGIYTHISLRYSRKVVKFDYTEKANTFIEKKYDDVMDKKKKLHEGVKALEKLIPLVCLKLDCKHSRRDIIEVQ